MGKVKIICRVLMPFLVVVGMALSPFGAMETALLLEGGAVAAATAPVEVIVCAPDEAAPDSDFTADVSIGEVANFDGCYYDVIFDTSVLRLDDVTTGLIGSTTIPVETYWEVSPGTWRVVQSIPGAIGVTGSGYLAVLHFHVIGSEGDSSAISLSDSSLYDTMAEEIAATWTGDSIVVAPVLPGDANSDGVINALDITKVERIIALLDAPTPGADVNQDGTINALDITATKWTICCG
jgi:hypothetical protein